MQLGLVAAVWFITSYVGEHWHIIILTYCKEYWHIIMLTYCRLRLVELEDKLSNFLCLEILGTPTLTPRLARVSGLFRKVEQTFALSGTE